MCMNLILCLTLMQRYDTLSYMDVLSRDLKVMDAAAISLAHENSIPIIVFSIKTRKMGLLM